MQLLKPCAHAHFSGQLCSSAQTTPVLRRRSIVLLQLSWIRVTDDFHLKKLVGPLRRALIYGLISYAGLVLINSSELDLPNMWIAYLPMFIGVYVVTQWLDKKLGD
jgi:hypothetical protein